MRRPGSLFRWHRQTVLAIASALLPVFFFLACSDSGNGGSSGGSTPTSVSMRQVFPLSSGWVTDNWTLFVDYKDHEINGTTTRAMVDTRAPVVMYWTNDDNGLLLHAIKELKHTGGTFVFPEPIKFANPVMGIGDTVEGGFVFMEDSVSYRVELVDIGAVSVPAGTFDVCGQFQMKGWTSESSPDEAPVETFWLCEGVGFTKGQSEAVPPESDLLELEVFTDSGETRELISYHLTPDVEDPEAAAVKECWNEDILFFQQEDLDAIAQAMDEQYYDRRCRDKNEALADWEWFFGNAEEYVGFGTVEEVTFNSDSTVAYVLREYLDSYWWYGQDPNGVRDHAWSRRISKYVKNNGVWEGYGAQTDLTPNLAWAFVYIRKVPDEPPYLATSCGLYDCSDGVTINSTEKVSSFLLNGPPGSGINAVDLTAGWDPSWNEFFVQRPLSEVANPSGFYTFEVVDQNMESFVFTRYFGKPVVLPEASLNPLISDGTSMTFSWEWGPGELDLYLERVRYRIEIHDSDWNRMWQVYINDYSTKTHTVSLQELNLPAGTYNWRVRVRYYNKYGGYSQMISESRTAPSEFTIE